MKGNFGGELNFINIGNMQENAKFKPIDCTVFLFAGLSLILQIGFTYSTYMYM